MTGIKPSYDNRRRRQGIYAFLAAYIGLMLTIVILELVRNHQMGGGFIW